MSSNKSKTEMFTLFLDGNPVGEFEVTGDREKDINNARQLLKDKGLYKEVTLIQAMFTQAVSFASTAKHVYDQDLRRFQSKRLLGMVPFIVNSAFSIEVYLKTIHQISGNSVKGHSLIELYDSLPNDQKEKILRAASRFSNEYNFSEPVPFRDFVCALDKAFVEWRYVYEKQKTEEIMILPTIFIMKVLHEVCKESGKT